MQVFDSVNVRGNDYLWEIYSPGELPTFNSVCDIQGEIRGNNSCVGVECWGKFEINRGKICLN